uniref:Glucosylceramidase n=1 Tax=Acrobeloides nanus TaxID=290746 RepID=A0A914C772_9BILA
MHITWLMVLKNWVTGWVDWNMVLDPIGGPNWVGNLVDAPILVSNTTDEFEKQPMYYALGHLAKFIVPGSVMIRVNTSGITNTTNIDVIAALTPSGQKVVVINNKYIESNAHTYQVSIINKQGGVINLSLEQRSFTTIVYND